MGADAHHRGKARPPDFFAELRCLAKPEKKTLLAPGPAFRGIDKIFYRFLPFLRFERRGVEWHAVALRGVVRFSQPFIIFFLRLDVGVAEKTAQIIFCAE
jgi:hypothetical protein